MAQYKVVLEIELDAENPLEAAKLVEQWVKEDGNMQYYVQNSNDEIFSVDLSEDEGDEVQECEYYPLIK